MSHLQNTNLPCTVSGIEESIQQHARYSLCKDVEEMTGHDVFVALSLAVRDRLTDRLLDTEKRYRQTDAKRVYYLSAEFLIGRSLENNLYNLELHRVCREAVGNLGFDLEAVMDEELDAALGNGGLGRLAACFLDSMATLGIPGFGYGINYEFGLFKQEIRRGHQIEKPDNWLAAGTPWEIAHPEDACLIPVYGRIEPTQDRSGEYNPMWMDWKLLVGVPYDIPIAGYGGRTVNYLRLYSARASQEFDMQIFNEGDYFRAVEQKMASETVSKVLYPSDWIESGRELRLVQEYFLVACAVRDIVNRYLQAHDTFDEFAQKVAIQMNDTHPALTVAELMRLLVDEKSLSWDEAWETTTATCAYTNHTLMGEAMERWSVDLLERVVPRHHQIICEIDRRFTERVSRVWPGDAQRAARMSIIEDGHPKHARMAHLAILGGHSVNGVSRLHSELIKSSLASDFHKLWPERFNNKTNGVTPRRWLLQANPLLADLITKTAGESWPADLERLRVLEDHAEDSGFQHEFMEAKRANRQRLAEIIKQSTGITVDADTLFDVQVKRLHEYKRQLLNAMGIIHEYLSLVEDGREPPVPRTYVFAGKAASGYWQAKQIIKLINSLGEVINKDPRVDGKMRVVFVPDYKVSVAEKLIPAADLSEQISTAGMEASGTGNMKLAMNGALTIGTLDGANIEIRAEVGEDNIFIFGLKADEIQQMQEEGSYQPRALYEADPHLKRVVNSFKSNTFCPGEPGLFKWIYDSLLAEGDTYFHLADFASYVEAQALVGSEFKQPAVWARKAILNVARMGKFSSDRTIAEYAEDIWQAKAVV